jgi:L-seryl-tRNA(Ser) seleniumtransferase
MDRLPDTTGLRGEIVIQRAHLTAYTHALRIAGARLVDVGYQGVTWPWQIEAAIGERTAAVAFSVGEVPGAVPLEEIVAVAHRHDLPVIVDAAAALPPVTNLRCFVTAGADLVAFSGGKAIGGPQASGILVGRADLIASVALQHQDMDVHPATWTWRDRYLGSGRLPGPPHHGIGRPMKVGKEEIAGLVVALRRFLARDHEAERRGQERQIDTMVGPLAGVPGVRASRRDGAVPLALVHVDEGVVGRSVEAIINGLLDGDPPIAVSQGFWSERALGLVPSTLRPGEAEIVGMRLRDVLAGRA